MMSTLYRIGFFVLIVFSAVQSSWAEPATDEFQEGVQYQRIEQVPPINEHTGKVEVVEMFLFACPHCYELAPKLQQWLQDKPYVEYHRIPAILGPSWADQARAFFIMQELGESEALGQALFKAIHDDGKQIYNEYAVVEFFTGQGIPRQKVIDLYYSPEIMAGINEARARSVKYGLVGVPAVIVNGKYKTAPFFVSDQEEMLQVLDSLVERERQQMGTTESSNQ